MMGESRHTPGPWSASWRNSRERDMGHGLKMWETPVSVGAPENAGNTIAIVYMGGPGATSAKKEAVEANARLIAAAPELLAALECAHRGFRYIADLSDDVGTVNCALSAAAMIDEAISKAKGEAA